MVLVRVKISVPLVDHKEFQLGYPLESEGWYTGQLQKKGVFNDRKIRPYIDGPFTLKRYDKVFVILNGVTGGCLSTRRRVRLKV